MKNQSGQVLLIIILLSTVLLTIGLSISQINTQETKIAKLEEESKKAFAAAEAGLDAALKTGDMVIGVGGLNMGEGITGEAKIDTTAKPIFISPLLKKDEQYTFYLTSYDRTTNQFTGQSINENITLCFESPAVEITLLKQNELKRYVLDSSGQINGASSPSSCSLDSNFSNSTSIPSADIGTDSKLLIVRVLFSNSRLRFSRASNFPLQGKTIISSAATATNVTKKIELFQSLPQIPADFFVTSF